MSAGKLKKKLNIVYRLYELLDELLRTFMTYFTVRVSLYVYICRVFIARQMRYLFVGLIAPTLVTALM